MIYANIELIIKRGETIAKNTLYLYRGDKNVEVRFILKDNHFIVEGSTFAQLIIKRPSDSHIFSEISKIDNKTVVFLITGDMIDEIKEVGLYDIQIRLYDDNQQARVTLPPAYGALEVRRPIVSIDEVGIATVGDISISYTEEEGNYFDEEGNYNATEWKDGDIISDYRLNKIEGALSFINDKIPSHEQYITDSELESKGYATENYVDIAINNAKLEGEEVDLSDYAKKTELPTKTSQLTNDSNFISSIPSEYVTDSELNAKGYATETYVDEAVESVDVTSQLSDYAKKSDIPSVPTKVSELENDKGYLTEHQDISHLVTQEEVYNTLDKYATKTYVSSEIAKAQLEGEGIDLSGYATKDDIPTKTSQLTNDSGFLTSIPNEYVTDSELNNKGYATQSYVDDAIDGVDVTEQLQDYAKKSELHSHSNKSVLDEITSNKITSWDNKSTFDGDYNSLTNKPTIPTVPTNISAFTNDKGYLTSVPSEYVTDGELIAKGFATQSYVDDAIDGVDVTEQLNDYAKKSDIPTKVSQLTNDSKFITSIPSEYVTETELNAKGYLTEHQSLADYAKKTDLHSHSNKSVLDGITSVKVSSWDSKSTFSGSYNDLTNKPTIPSIEGLATEGYVNNMLGGLRLIRMTQSEYDALGVKDSNTLYIII